MDIEKLEEIIHQYGLHLDYDQWKVDAKKWVRVKKKKHFKPLIIYREHIESDTEPDGGIQLVRNILINYLIEYGKHLQQQETKRVLGL